MPSNAENIIQVSNLIVQFTQEEEIDPMVAMTAMLQLSAKIAHDSGEQEKLSKSDNRSRWMGAVMLAFDIVEGGEAGFGEDPKTSRRHLSICPGVGKGSKQGFAHRRKLERTRRSNKQARKTRRSQRR